MNGSKDRFDNQALFEILPYFSPIFRGEGVEIEKKRSLSIQRPPGDWSSPGDPSPTHQQLINMVLLLRFVLSFIFRCCIRYELLLYYFIELLYFACISFDILHVVSPSFQFSGFLLQKFPPRFGYSTSSASAAAGFPKKRYEGR